MTEQTKILWEKPENPSFESDTGATVWRLIIFRWAEDERLTAGGSWEIKDIVESDKMEWLEDMLLKLTTPWSGRVGRKLRRRMA